MRPVIAFFLLALTFGANQAFAETRYFQSPSGNIRCVIAEAGGNAVRCDLSVMQQTYTERPESCAGDWGRSFGVRETGAGFLLCVAGGIDPLTEMPVLPYGVALDLQGITCQSATTGITCTNSEGGGFSVRRAEQRIF